MGGPQGKWHFPVDQPNVFTLKNLEASHIYFNNPELFHAALQVETDKCDAIFNHHHRTMSC